MRKNLLKIKRWSDTISSKEVEFEMLSINVEVLEILVGGNISRNKLELSVSIKLSIEPESSYFGKAILTRKFF